MDDNRLRRRKRGLGPLRKEIRTSPLAAVVNGMVGIAFLGGAALVEVLKSARDADGPKSLGLILFLVVLFALAGIGFLVFALVQMFTRLRVFDKGLVWHRYGKKRVILWPAVQGFRRGDSEAPTLNVWSMLLYSGERIDFHSGLYRRSEFQETMELIAEQIAETQKQLG
jgi:hypothetical protein